jgi:1-deoxy-D-xylulose-5-phosphate reductoisomerase
MINKTQKKIAIFGSTGSIGNATIKIVENCDDFEVVLLSCGSNFQEIYNQSVKLRPKYILLGQYGHKDHHHNEYHWIKKFESIGVKVLFAHSDSKIICDIDFELAVVGVKGFDCLYLMQNLVSNSHLKKICLANKESIVCLGDLLLDVCRNRGIKIVPVDSEHNSIYQILSLTTKQVKSILLTASGGSVLDKSIDDLQKIELKDVLKHPNWSMGKEITINSSTMANKGLELIEACRLFAVSQKNVEVAISKKSIVHGGIFFKDKTFVSFASHPNMILHIAHSMFYPFDIPSNITDKFFVDFDIYESSNTSFEKLDYQKYPMLAIARFVADNSFFSLAYNCINEFLVEKFINKEIKFSEIAKLTDKNLSNLVNKEIAVNCFESAFEAKRIVHLNLYK